MLLFYQLWYLTIHVTIFTELFKLLILDNFKKFYHIFPLKFNGIYVMDKWCITLDTQLFLKQMYNTIHQISLQKTGTTQNSPRNCLLYVFTC